MKHILVILTIIATVASFSSDARADNGQIAAGMLGGLAAGGNFDAAATPRPHYFAPVRIEPVNAEPHCYWPRGELVWNDGRQAWVRSGAPLCD